MTKLSYITTNQQNICIDFITPRIELGDLWNLLTTSRKQLSSPQNIQNVFINLCNRNDYDEFLS